MKPARSAAGPRGGAAGAPAAATPAVRDADEDVDDEEERERREAAATRIQALARGHLARNEYADRVIHAATARLSDASRSTAGEHAPLSSPGSAAGRPALDAAARADEVETFGEERGRFDARRVSPKTQDAVARTLWPTLLREDFAWTDLPADSADLLRQLRATGDLRVYACTWNMHGKPPSKLGELSLLAPAGRYHVLAFGSEECERSIQASMVNPSKELWEAALDSVVGPAYRRVASQTLQAIHLTVFVHAALLPLVGDVQCEALPCGFGQTMGNKGAAAVGFVLGTTALLFVNCHLAAHQHAVDERNAQWRRIETGLRICPKGYDPRPPRASDRYDRVVWMGDMNYRIDASRELADVLLREGHHAELLHRDQLRRAMRRGAVFQGFGEGPLHFRPTYKYDAHSDTYDSSAKRRVPSWTDRILVKPPNETMTVRSYFSLDRLRASDHRPVIACVSVRLCRRIDTALLVTPTHAHPEPLWSEAATRIGGEGGSLAAAGGGGAGGGGAGAGDGGAGGGGAGADGSALDAAATGPPPVTSTDAEVAMLFVEFPTGHAALVRRTAEARALGAARGVAVEAAVEPDHLPELWPTPVPAATHGALVSAAEAAERAAVSRAVDSPVEAALPVGSKLSQVCLIA